MKMMGIVICFVLICLILFVIYDFIISRKRNRKKFGSDFLFDAIDKGSNASNNKSLDEHNLTSYSLADESFKKFIGLKKDKKHDL